MLYRFWAAYNGCRFGAWLIVLMMCCGVGSAENSPTISLVHPAEGEAGSIVTIDGTFFAPTASDNQVFFGGVAGRVVSGSATQLQVRVPSFASGGPLSVTAGRLSAFSRTPFRQLFQAARDPSPASFVRSAGGSFLNGSGPGAIASADFDRDGSPELIILHFYRGIVTVLPNRGSGRDLSGGIFSTPIEFEVGDFPKAVVVADFNGDGAPDLLVMNRGSLSLSVLINSNDGLPFHAGSLTLTTNLATLHAPYGVVAGDLDGDGRVDIAAVVQGGLCLFRNTSDAKGVAFTEVSPLVAPLEEPAALVIADLDGDGRAELAATRSSGDRLVVWKNQSTPGNLQFESVVDLAYGLSTSIATPDLNGDGKPDLCLAQANSGGVVALRNSSASGALSAGTLDNDEVSPFASINPRLLACELSGDGAPDLLVIDDGYPRLRWLVNTLDTERFTPRMFAAPVDLPLEFKPSDAAVADFDGDGIPDIAVCGLDSDQWIVLQSAVARLNQIEWIQPKASGSGLVSGPLTLEVGLFWGAAEVLGVDFLVNERVIGTASSAPYRVSWIPAAGSSDIVAVARDASGGWMRSAPIHWVARPPNDSFQARTVLSGATVLGTGNSQEATSEDGEPVHAGVPGGRSLWWSWTAPSNGVCTMGTDGSAFDTLLAVYRGEALKNLQLVAANDDNGGELTSQLTFVAEKGVTYQIAVDGNAGSQGAVRLIVILEPAPPSSNNDRFENRFALPSTVDDQRISLTFGTRQAGEPSVLPTQSGHSLWWSWKATRTGRIALKTFNADFDHLLAIFRGSQWDSMKLVTSGNGFRCCGGCHLSLAVVAGEEYSLLVDGLNGDAGSLSFSLQDAIAPSNDRFATPWLLDGFPATDSGSNEEATAERYEPILTPMQSGHSLWWEWHAPSSGTVLMSTEGTAFPHMMAVFKGTVLTNLSVVASNVGPYCCIPGKLSFEAVRGQKYLLFFDGLRGASGDFHLSLLTMVRPDNDRFVSSRQVRGEDIVLTGSNVGATQDSGEPKHYSDGAGKSVWWTWVAEQDGAVSINTQGSSFECAVGVYTGDQLQNLSVVGRYTGLHLKSQTFDVEAGHVYHIAVDGIGDSEGRIILALSAGARPANDLFANRIPLLGASAQTTGRNVSASLEPREPNRSGFVVGNSVWWTWTSGKSEVVVVTTEGTDFDHVVSVYSGSSFSNLNPIGTSVGLQCCGPAKVVIDNNANTVYQISISGIGEAAGNIALSIDPVPRPPADLFITRPVLNGSSASWEGVNINASKRYDEPNHGGNPGGRSLWWRWTAPSTGTLSLQLTNSDFQSVIAVYVGSLLEALSPVASRIADEGATQNELRLNVIAGTEYEIAVDGVNGQEGHVSLKLQLDSGRFDFDSTPKRSLWIPDGPVNAMVETNGILYVGGDFHLLSPNRGSGVAVDVDFQQPELNFPTAVGQVRAVISDGAGGFFVGGTFDSIGGQPCRNLAHILADRSVDPLWAPAVSGSVETLAAWGNLLFVGGNFSTLEQETLFHLAAFDLPTGALLAWNAAVDRPVTRLMIYSGSLYLAGEFSQVLGQPRRFLAQLDLGSLSLTAWRPDPDAPVRAMAATCDVLYFGGDFLNIAGNPRTRVAAFSARDTQLTGWSPAPDCSVSAMAATQDALYLGGCFESIDGVPRTRLAAFQSVTGELLGWNPTVDAPVSALGVGNRTVYAGGEFSRANGERATAMVLLDPVTGRTIPFPGMVSGRPVCFGLSGRMIFAGGAVLAEPGVSRRGLAAIDLSTGLPTAWDPQVQGSVERLFLNGDTLFVGGNFTAIGGSSRTHLASFALGNLRLSNWAPSLDGPVRAMTGSSKRLYVGGPFQHAEGAEHSGLVSWTLPGLTLDSKWQSSPDGSIADLALRNSVLYVAGSFSSLAGSSRRGVAAVDGESGSLLPWDAGLDGDVEALLVDAPRLWVAGSFQKIRGQSVPYLAGVSLDNGSLSLVPPLAVGLGSSSDTPVSGIAGAIHRITPAGNGRLFLGGKWRFDSGEISDGLALIRQGDGAPYGWAVPLDEPVGALLSNGKALYAGGSFHRVNGAFFEWWMAFPPVGSPSPINVPERQRLVRGETLNLQVAWEGQQPMSLQWALDGIPIDGATNSSISIPNVSNSDGGPYTVTARNALGVSITKGIDVEIAVPPTILRQPRSQTVVQGSTVSLSVDVDASPRPRYQWLCNGIQVPGAVRPTLTLAEVQPDQGGRYTVQIQGSGVSIESAPATLVVAAPLLGLSDNYADRRSTNSYSGVGRGNNSGATREVGEPPHAGKRGGVSVWFSWVAPASGTAVFSTRGSAVDTLMAVYRNAAPELGIGGLVPLTSDDDLGGFLTSVVSFEATEGVPYDIAIDGVSGSSGSIILSWQLTVAENTKPRIVVPPSSKVAAVGEHVRFEVLAVSTTPMHYQWYQNCAPIPGSDTPQLVLSSVPLNAVGRYYVVVRNELGESQSPSVDLALVDGASDAGKGPSAADKFSDLLDINPTLADVSGLGYLGLGRPIYFDTLDSTKELDEPNHCGVVGGASKWIPFKVPVTTDVVLSTEGSTFNTTLAVYTLNGPTLRDLVPVACDTDNGEDRKTSLLSFVAEEGPIYYIAVDGVDGATGVVRLSATAKPLLTTPTMVANQYTKMRLWGLPSAPYLVEISSDLLDWEPLVVTNATRESILLRDASASQVPQRFYRATPLDAR